MNELTFAGGFSFTEYLRHRFPRYVRSQVGAGAFAHPPVSSIRVVISRNCQHSASEPVVVSSRLASHDALASERDS